MSNVEITETREQFTITARSSFGTVYTAIFRVCGCDRTPCADAYDHGKGVKSAAPGCDGSNKNHCHGSAMYGYHRIQVERVASQVARTYQRWRPTARTLPGITAWMRKQPRVLVPCPSWPTVKSKPLPPLCDCESCRRTLALIGGDA